ncbi:hypothetical protein DPMN_088412 [Dreissena polymorpha]|uniref:Uncharacterized protein n=1 Tax=Dreissena polymorpha TaxID=45954 RepID=A0A9D4KVU0_DREPO|nr:hypothetical protein DPMN_088412 [Dreissena polymorpha]
MKSIPLYFLKEKVKQDEREKRNPGVTPTDVLKKSPMISVQKYCAAAVSFELLDYMHKLLVNIEYVYNVP